jgi:hypothetical protein
MVAADRVKTSTPETPVCPCNECHVLPFSVSKGASASSIRAFPYVAYILIGRTLSGGDIGEIGCIVVGSQAFIVSRFFLSFVDATCLLLLQTR